MKSDISFVKHGELVNFLYQALGILPRKKAKADAFDEEQKKVLQKKLSRLIKEQGNLPENFLTSIQTLLETMKDFVPDSRMMNAFENLIFTINKAYSDLVRLEGTYLDRKESLRYFISVKAIFQIVVSINRSSLRYRLHDVVSNTPTDQFWYLPSVDNEDKVTLPLEKVMRWAYQICDTSQTQFHYLGKNVQSENQSLQNNLDNAINWIYGVSLPALPALLKNFDDSFIAMAHSGHVLSESVQQDIKTALVISRLTTHITNEIVQTYGIEYLKELCTQFTNYMRWISDDITEFKTEIQKHMDKKSSLEEKNELWLDAFYGYWQFFSTKIYEAQDKFERLKEARNGNAQAIPENVLASLTSKYGDFAVKTCIDMNNKNELTTPPDHFAHMVSQGFQMKQAPDAQWEQIDEYAQNLKLHGLEDHLCWMEPWLRAVYLYRAGEFKSAMDYYQTAFDNAKYRAGKSQYALVNQYVEVAAKNDKWQCFKKGVEWARYLGIQIRWLRDDEPTKDNLLSVFEIFKMASYDHQM